MLLTKRQTLLVELKERCRAAKAALPGEAQPLESIRREGVWIANDAKASPTLRSGAQRLKHETKARSA